MKVLLTIFIFFSLASTAQTVRLNSNAGATPAGTTKVFPTTNTATPVGTIRVNFTRIISNTFFVPFAGTASAGIYKYDGQDTILVRSLFSNIAVSSGPLTLSWDGKDDNGNTLPSAGIYSARLLTNNITTSWGVIGNTSLTSDGTSYQGYSNLHDMCFVGSTAYVAGGFNEASPSKFKFNTSSPQVKTNILPSYQGTSQDTRFVATDGTLVYWAESAPFDSMKSWVHATNVSDDAQHTFTNGRTIQPQAAIQFNSVISYDSLHNYITGLAVDADYLFVARGGLNQLKVYSTATGAIIQTLTYTNPRGIKVDGSNFWMITGTNTVSKYPINPNGTLGTATLTLSGTVNPVAINTNASNIAVVDGGTSQQVKFFNKTTGVAGTVVGQSGGYATDATVANDKFMFQRSDKGTEDKGYIAFQTDGSYWVGDYGNMRNQHFSSSHTFIDNIAFLGETYAAGADVNNPTRIFANLLEFSRDYSKPLQGNNGSWALVKSWTKGLPTSYISEIGGKSYLQNITTLSNGRTYVFVVTPANDSLECVELVSGGTARLTGKRLPTSLRTSMDASGDIYYVTSSGALSQNLNSVYYKKSLTGFDGSNNPLWGTAAIVTTITGVTSTDPVYRGDKITSKEITSTAVRISYLSGVADLSNVSVPIPLTGYHLGGWKNNKWLWKAAPSTHVNYAGDFPSDGTFDIGNQSRNNAGGPTKALDRLIVQGYQGEFWKEGQTNMYNLFYDNGLLLGQFGTSTKAYQFGAPTMAGNALVNTLTKVGSDYYLHHNDESYNGGVHEFKISNVSSVNEQIIPIAFPSSYTPPTLDYTDLMSGLLFDSVVANNVNGWTRTPTTEQINPANRTTNYFTVRTSKYTYSKAKGHDVYIFSRIGAGLDYNVSRDLGTNTGLPSWTLACQIAISSQDFVGHHSAMIEALDNTGKVIARLNKFTPSYASSGFHVAGNGTDIVSNISETVMEGITNKLQNLSITATSAGITFNYAGYTPITVAPFDNTSNWQNPKTLRIRFLGGDASQARDRIIDLKDLKFYNH